MCWSWGEGQEGGRRIIMVHCAKQKRPALNETRLPPNKSTCTGPKQSAAPAFGRLVWSMMLSTLQIPEKHASSIIETSSSSSTLRLSSSTTDCNCFVKSSFVLNSLSNLRARFTYTFPVRCLCCTLSGSVQRFLWTRRLFDQRYSPA